MHNITTKLFVGTILADKDPEKKGRYKVDIPALQPLLNEADRGIWVKNHIHKYRDNTSSEYGRYGQYFPIQANAKVLVRFYSNDTNSGYIDEILDDDIPNPNDTGTSLSPDKEYTIGEKRLGKYKISLPFNSEDDRDDIYQLIRTPKYQNLIAISEDTSGNPLPSNSIHIYYNKDRSQAVINENGYHLITNDNKSELIQQSLYQDIMMNRFEYIEGDKHSIVNSESREYIKNNKHLISDKSIYFQANSNAIHLLAPGNFGTINEVASQNINLSTISDSSLINLTAGKSITIFTHQDGSTITIAGAANINIASTKKITISSLEEIEFTSPKISFYANKIDYNIITSITKTFTKSLKRAKNILEKVMGKFNASQLFKAESNQKIDNSYLPDKPETETKIQPPSLSALTLESVMSFIRACITPPKVDKVEPPTSNDVRSMKSMRSEALKPDTIKYEK